MGSAIRRSALLALAATALTAPAAHAAGPIQSGLGNPTVKTLKPGVTLSTYKVSVNDYGVLRSQTIYKVAWTIGNAHVQLNTAALGTYYADDGSIRLGHISTWAGNAGLGSSLVAAINGDFFADSRSHGGAGVPSGMAVSGRVIDDFGWGGPAVGYMPSGDMVMGRPLARPVTIALPGGKQATVGSFNGLTAGGVTVHGDQVAAYTTTGATVTVPSGYVGYVVPSTILRGTLRGVKGGWTFTAGANVKETVAGYRFADQTGTAVVSAMPTSQPAACPTGTCAAGVRLTVPSSGVVLLARAGGVAATGLSAKAAAGGSVNVTLDDSRWAKVADVMGGKPQLVRNGSPTTTRPSFVDPWQWDNPHWRPAVATSANGQGWLLVAGGNGGVGIKAGTWSRMLVQLGARNAMGFDNNSSTELFRPGVAPLTAYGYERSIPLATFLTYR